MAECVILEAAEAEEGKIFEEDANDVLIKGGSSFEECLIQVQVVPPDTVVLCHSAPKLPPSTW